MIQETTIKTCERCQQDFTTPMVFSPFDETKRWEEVERDHCDSCSIEIEREAQHQRAEAEAAMREHEIRAYFQKTCPDRYRATNQDDERFNADLWGAVSEWLPSSEVPWLGLIGASGLCKTRIAWLKARQMLYSLPDSDFDMKLPEGRRLRWNTIYAITDCELRNAAYGRFGSDDAKRESEELLREIRQSPILIYDDIGKVKITDAVSAEMFNLIEYRHAWNLPMIWTSNLIPGAFCKNLDPSFAEPLKGRLLECSHIIHMKP